MTNPLKTLHSGPDPEHFQKLIIVQRYISGKMSIKILSVVNFFASWCLNQLENDETIDGGDKKHITAALSLSSSLGVGKSTDEIASALDVASAKCQNGLLFNPPGKAFIINAKECLFQAQVQLNQVPDHNIQSNGRLDEYCSPESGFNL